MVCFLLQQLDPDPNLVIRIVRELLLVTELLVPFLYRRLWTVLYDSRGISRGYRSVLTDP